MMKIQTPSKLLSIFFASVIFSNCIATNAVADTFLGSNVEVGVWKPSYAATFFGQDAQVVGEDEAIYASATVEHALPFVPNAKISVTQLEADLYEYIKVDYTGYYEVLDNDIVSIDVGAGVTVFNGNELIEEVFDGPKPHLYLNAEVQLPIPNTSLYADIRYLKFEGEELNDSAAGIKYDIDLEAVDIGLQAGYRVQSFTKEGAEVEVDFNGSIIPITGDLDVENDGYFIGINADF